MMTTTFAGVKRILAVVMALGVLNTMMPPAQAAPSDAERIVFPANSVEVNLVKTVEANNAKRFVFNAQLGEEIALTVTPKVTGARLGIDLNGKTVTPGKLYSTRVSKAGSFTIQIVNYDDVNRSVYLDLGVAVPPKTASSTDKEKINFGKDIIEVNLVKTVKANDAKRFIFNGAVGQDISITLTPKVNGSNLGIDLNGKALTVGKLYSTKVSKAGSFTIQVINYDDVDRVFYLDVGLGGPVAQVPAPAATTPEKVVFNKDIIEVNLVKTVEANNARRFSFHADKGQEIVITVTPKVKGANISATLGNRTLPIGTFFKTHAANSGTFVVQVTNFDDVDRSFALDMGVFGP